MTVRMRARRMRLLIASFVAILGLVATLKWTAARLDAVATRNEVGRKPKGWVVLKGVEFRPIEEVSPTDRGSRRTHRAAIVDEHHLTALRIAMTKDPKTADDVLRRVHELREQLYDHLADCIGHRGGEHQIVEGSPLHRAFADAITASSLTGTPARWSLAAPGSPARPI